VEGIEDVQIIIQLENLIVRLFQLVRALVPELAEEMPHERAVTPRARVTQLSQRRLQRI